MLCCSLVLLVASATAQRSETCCATAATHNCRTASLPAPAAWHQILNLFAASRAAFAAASAASRASSAALSAPLRARFAASSAVRCASAAEGVRLPGAAESAARLNACIEHRTANCWVHGMPSRHSPHATVTSSGQGIACLRHVLMCKCDSRSCDTRHSWRTTGARALTSYQKASVCHSHCCARISRLRASRVAGGKHTPVRIR